MNIAVHNYLKKLDVQVAAPAPTGTYLVPQLCAKYDFPKNLPVGGVIGIVELGGGYQASDVTRAFADMKLPAPTIVDVSVDGTNNTPGGQADGEVALDIQVAGAVYAYCTGHAASIRVYWTQNIQTGIEAAARDGCSVCSISWGADEAAWGLAAAQALDAAAAAALAANCIVFAAAGDNDSSDAGTGATNVDLPAGCPHVIGCGGTARYFVSGFEKVWNTNSNDADGSGTGGGYSAFFPAQSWQVGIPPAPAGKGRMVPDCAGDADPNTGYQIILDGQLQVYGGTSAVAPLYAGLFASFGDKVGLPLGAFYTNPECFNDITIGNNGTYRAAVGPDACSGMGSPKGTALYEAFKK